MINLNCKKNFKAVSHVDIARCFPYTSPATTTPAYPCFPCHGATPALCARNALKCVNVEYTRAGAGAGTCPIESVSSTAHTYTYTSSRPSSSNHLRLSQPLEQLSNQHVTLCDIIELEDDAPKRQKPVTRTSTTFALCRRQRQNASSYQIQLQPDSCLIPIQLRLLFRPGVRRVFWEAAASAHLRHGDDSHR